VQSSVDEGIELSTITAATTFRVNISEPSLRPYAKQDEKVFTVITGHKNGKVVYWENTEYKGYLDKCKSEILAIVSYSKGVVIATGKSELHFVSIFF